MSTRRSHYAFHVPRTRDFLYAGAIGRIDAACLSRLGSGYVLQPKQDGVYCLITTDRTGLVGTMRMRSGATPPLEIARQFVDVRWAPDSVLVCELEAFTEASERLAAVRGYRNAPIFDALRVSGRDVSSLPQSARRDSILRALEQLGEDHRIGRKRSGQFTHRRPRDFTRLPLVPELPVSAYSSAMSEWVDTGDAEGLVVVAQSAPIGGRGAKRKHKRHEFLDALVLDRDKSAARVSWRGHQFIVSCQGEKNAAVRVGDVVEIKADGWCERTVSPKFPRIVRVRPDLRA